MCLSMELLCETPCCPLCDTAGYISLSRFAVMVLHVASSLRGRLHDCLTAPSAQTLLGVAVCQVLEGELAQRAEATRRLREVQKQLMLLGGLVPPSPVVTAAAAAAARGRRNSGNPLSSGGFGSSGGMSEEATLMQETKNLQDSIDGHTKSIKVRAAGD